jgi:hypothetical protein
MLLLPVVVAAQQTTALNSIEQTAIDPEAVDRIRVQTYRWS